MKFVNILLKTSTLIFFYLPSYVFAQEVIGIGKPWGMGLQQAGSELAQQVTEFHDALLIIITLISLFVLGLLVWIVIKFSESNNPNPSKTTHNTLLEVLWTVIPVLVLVFIAIPSFKLLYKADVVPDADMTIKAIGHQWYWSYEYPDYGNFTYDAFLVEEEGDLEDSNKPFHRLLTTDTAVVVPVGKIVRMQITSSGVIHSWALPALNVKIDAVPGRLNETWFKAEKEGIYYGLCSELCGLNHGKMPIEVHVVSESVFNLWIEKAKELYADNNEQRIQVGVVKLDQ